MSHGTCHTHYTACHSQCAPHSMLHAPRHTQYVHVTHIMPQAQCHTQHAGIFYGVVWGLMFGMVGGWRKRVPGYVSQVRAPLVPPSCPQPVGSAGALSWVRARLCGAGQAVWCGSGHVGLVAPIWASWHLSSPASSRAARPSGWMRLAARRKARGAAALASAMGNRQ